MENKNTRRGNTQHVINAVDYRSGFTLTQGARLSVNVKVKQLQPSGQALTYKCCRGFISHRHRKLVSGSSRFRRGFTLIELLVVVLIIGILAAIALPQYNKAVLKTRISPLLLFQRNAMQALDSWVLENEIEGVLNFIGPDANASLDLDLTQNMTCTGTTCTDNNNWKYMVAAEDGSYGSIVRFNPSHENEDFIEYSRDLAGNTTKVCYCMSGEKEAIELCEALHSLDNSYAVGY